MPGAVNLDVTAADFESKAAALDKSKTYLVYCASGVRSVRACEQLARLKFPRLYNLPGGFRAWAKAGKPLSNNPVASTGLGVPVVVLHRLQSLEVPEQDEARPDELSIYDLRLPIDDFNNHETK